MRVICPHCQKSVTLADSTANQPTVCPECGQIFNAPALMTAAEMAPAAPPAPEPSLPPPVVVAPPPPPSASMPAPSERASASESASGVKFTLNEKVVRWIGPVAVILLFLLSFFTWIGSYPGGYPVYTQSAWGAAFGTFTSDIATKEAFGREAELKEQSRFSPVMFLVCLLILIATPFAVGDLFQEYINIPIPDPVQALWPYRNRMLAGVTLLIFLILTLQLMAGFGMESDAAAAADKLVASIQPDLSKPGEAPQNTMRRELDRAIELNRFSLKRTTALWLAYLASAGAIIGFGLELLLDRRDKRRPMPSLELRW